MNAVDILERLAHIFFSACIISATSDNQRLGGAFETKHVKLLTTSDPAIPKTSST